MRKVCIGMSKQRYLLILLGILISGLLSAQTGISFQNSFLQSTDGINSGRLNQQVFSMATQTSSGFRIGVRNDLTATSGFQGNYNQAFYDRFRVSARALHDSWNIGAAASVTMFGDPDELALFPQWQALVMQEKLSRSSTSLHASKSLSRLQIDGRLIYNNLAVDTSEFNFADFSFSDTGVKNISDFHGAASLSAELAKGLTLNAGFDYQDGFNDAPQQIRLTRTNLGVYHQARLNHLFALESRWQWQHRDSDALSPERANLYVSDFRLRLNLSPQLKGFVQYSNRSCSDNQLSELWLISNYLRAQLKHSFFFDENAASYLSLGAIYSPENQADAVFADTDLRVWGPWYAGAGINLRLDRQSEYLGKITHRFSSASELNLQFRHQKNKVDRWNTNYAGLGINLYY